MWAQFSEITITVSLAFLIAWFLITLALLAVVCAGGYVMGKLKIVYYQPPVESYTTENPYGTHPPIIDLGMGNRMFEDEDPETGHDQERGYIEDEILDIDDLDDRISTIRE